MQYNLGPSLEDPLIRWRRRFRRTRQSVRRSLWIHGKLFSFYQQQLMALVLAGLLVGTLHPVSVAQAADAAGAASSSRDAGLADFDFMSIEEVPADASAAAGFMPKPLVVTTDMGRPEREQLEAQAKQQALKKKKKAATVVRASVTTQASGEPIVAVAGNTYPYGYCTWWAKNRRPDLPNHLGNAKLWLMNAARLGFRTGKTPAVGAIVVTSESARGHVGYVEAVEGDTIIVSDMNVIGLGKVSKRHMNSNSSVIRGYIY